MGVIIEDFQDPYVIEVDTPSIDLLLGAETAYVIEVEGGPQGPPGASGGSAWSLITDKPATFPPDAHTHTSVDVTDFSSAVANLITGKADDSAVVKLTGNQTIGGIKTFSSNPVVPDGSWAISKTANLQASLDAKALDSAVVKLTGDQTIAGIKTFSSGPIIPDASLSIAKTSGLQAALDAKSATTHNHDTAYVALTGNQSIDGTKTFLLSPSVPDASFGIAKVSGLQTALNEKSDLGHGHATTELTDFPTEIRKTEALVFHNGTSWPLRNTVTTDSARRVRWVGPTAPTIGSGYAVDGLDIWELRT